MNKQTVIKLGFILCLAVAFALCLTACGGGGGDEGSGDDGGAVSFNGDKYVDEGSDFVLTTDKLPEGYACIPADQFKEGFKNLVNADTSATYADIAQAFGDDGIKMNGIVYDGYAYYAWYSDDDYLSDTKTNVLVTFKDDGGDLTYYAYSANGITPQDVE